MLVRPFSLQMNQFSFTITNTGQSYEFKRGYTLLNNLLLNDITTHAKCGGKAICGRCRVKITTELKHCNKPSAEEKIILSELELEDGWRLACQTHCIKNISLYIPELSELE